jgi:hypothetical protein
MYLTGQHKMNLAIAVRIYANTARQRNWMAKSRKLSYDEQRLASVDRADADQTPKPKRMSPLRLVGLRGKPMACNVHASHVAVGSPERWDWEWLAS